MLESLIFHVFTFKAYNIGFEFSSVTESLSIFLFGIIRSVEGDASLATSIINIQIILYLMMVFNIYIVAPSSSTSSLCKDRRILFIVLF